MRHPTEIPIEICRVQEPPAYHWRQMKNVSQGGLAFICTTDWQPGTSISIRLPLIKPPFEANGKVIWCRKRQHYFEVGVAFLEPDDAFTVRMIEQLCQIEMYRKRQEGEGRQLTAEEAAMEWINRYAEDFSEKAEQWKHFKQPKFS